MSANLMRKKNGQVAMAYVEGDEVPWHKEGQTVSPNASAEEIIEQAGLDWDVELRPAYIKDGDKYTIVPNANVIVRSDENIPLGVVGKVYRPLQNRDAFTFFNPIIEKGGARFATAGALGSGERVWVLAKLQNEDASIDIVPGDTVDKYILFSNTHDGSSAVKAFFTPIRVVCQNTLIMASQKQEATISIRHASSVRERVELAGHAMKAAADFYKEFEDSAYHLAQSSFDNESLTEYINRLTPSTSKKQEVSTRTLNIRKEILNLVENGKGNRLKRVSGTWWAAYNAVAEYADHYRSYRGDDTNRIKSILFGSAATLKKQAFSLALEYANKM